MAVDDKPISGLPPVTELTEPDPLVCVVGGVTSKISYGAFTSNSGVFLVPPPITVASAADAAQNAANINDTITAAFDNGGGTAQLRPGVYEVADKETTPKGYAVEMKSNVRLYGHSGGSTIKMYSGETREHSIIQNPAGGISDAEIAFMTIDGTRSRVPDTEWGISEHEGIDLKDSVRCRVFNLTIFDVAGDGIDIDNQLDCIVSDCFIYDCGGCAVHGTGDRMTITNINSARCGIYRLQSSNEGVRTSSGAISWGLGDFCVVSGCTSLNDSIGVLMDQCDRSTVSSCVCDDPGDGVARPTWPTPYSGGGSAYVLRDCITSVVVGCTTHVRGLDDSYGFSAEANNIRCSFVGCSSTLGKRGFQINLGEQTAIIGCIASVGQDRNIALDNAGPGCIVSGCVVFGGTNGIRVENGTDRAKIVANTVGSASNVGLYAIGESDAISFVDNIATACGTGLKFLVSGGTPTNCVASNNDLRGNITVNASIDGTGHKVRNNAGYNPVGIGAITVGASPFTYTAGFSRETVYVDGGTVSSVVKGGVTIATGSGLTVSLEPEESVTVTYSVVPTMSGDVH